MNLLLLIQTFQNAIHRGWIDFVNLIEQYYECKIGRNINTLYSQSHLLASVRLSEQEDGSIVITMHIDSGFGLGKIGKGPISLDNFTKCCHAFIDKIKARALRGHLGEKVARDAIR